MFQASQASLSASLRASLARSAECRTELPKRYSRDFVLILRECAGRVGVGKPLQIADLASYRVYVQQLPTHLYSLLRAQVDIYSRRNRFELFPSPARHNRTGRKPAWLELKETSG
jgi:hypothetical protein